MKDILFDLSEYRNSSLSDKELSKHIESCLSAILRENKYIIKENNRMRLLFEKIE